MTRLTMHAKGGMPSKSAEFVPPQHTADPRPQPRFALPLWVILGGGGVFLAMFTALIVLTTLVVVQSRETTRLQAAMTLNEPAAPAVLPVVQQAPVEPLPSAEPEAAEVTRTEVNLLATDNVQPVSTPARVEPLPLSSRIKPPSCVDYLDTLVKITHVRFPLGSNEPASADMPRVRNMATALRLCPEVKVIVEGHSDRRGGDKLNMDLSWYRAETVLDILRSEGFDTARMEPLGFGARQPINLSGTVSGEGENRRVQFQLVPHDMVIEALARN
ncbi:MAG: OmpA family protein [Pseudomonadota bacterium]